MSSVAEQLHLAREAKNLTVHQVAEVTKIRTDHIRALEEGNFNAFSAPVYIRGFVRTYAGLLKLDVPRLMTALDQELGATEKFREPPPLTDQPRSALDFITLQLSKVNWRIASVVIGVLVLLLIFYSVARASRHTKDTNTVVDIPPAVYQPAQTGDTLPLPAAPAHH
ncbi:MAG TPA: helix-turn-helix transcriptional regulator [Verrucomicrobiae bacterium]|jgi:cytoskeleton protein RodZ|nr:helix-turn-helix transcriptional regulator [Verrucomicrobiae bacterium]